MNDWSDLESFEMWRDDLPSTCPNCKEETLVWSDGEPQLSYCCGMKFSAYKYATGYTLYLNFPSEPKPKAKIKRGK